MNLPVETSVEIRVRYNECDSMGVAHHGSYLIWLEIARTELLRQRGTAYRDMEARGIYYVIARLSARYRKPARYDDVLRVRVWIAKAGPVKIDHAYEVFRGDELLCSAETTLVCVDDDGRIQEARQGE